MVAIHQKHETPIGTLSITVKPETSDQELEVRMEFECVETGAVFDASYAHPDLCSVCPIFGESEELMDTLREAPAITMTDAKDVVTARFMVRGRKREYPADLTLVRRVYDADKKDAIELRAENMILRRRLATIEDQVNRLALMTMLTTTNNHGECKELSKMIKSPLGYLEQIDNQFEMIAAMVNAQDYLDWFKSLNPDLRRFRPMRPDVSGLSFVINAILDHFEMDMVELIRYLISIHIDVNHVYNRRFYGKITCYECSTHDETRDDKWHDHRCTPLDSVLGHLRKWMRDEKSTDSHYGPGTWARQMSNLCEVERMLVDAGAKSYADL